MNKFIQAIKSLDRNAVEDLLKKEPKWLTWAEADGKNALHYLGGVVTGDSVEKEAVSLQIAKLLLQNGMDINSVHEIKDGEGCGFFPARPVWYAYTRGRNKPLYTWLLANGANPENCMFAIAWYNDTEAAALFKAHGATIDDVSTGDTPFLAAFNWKRYEVAEWFLNNGANVNARDKQGRTALYYAVKRKLKPELIASLLKYGADSHLKNNEGISAYQLALQNKQRNILKLFTSSEK